MSLTATATVSTRGKPNRKAEALPPERERFMQACADIAHQLIQDHEQNDGSKSLNLNALRGQVSKKHKLSTIPSLTAIMAAIPEHYKKYINWKLIQKPVRMSPFFCGSLYHTRSFG
jgi:elongator complex protein 3